MNRALIGAGVGALAIGGTIAWLATRETPGRAARVHAPEGERDPDDRSILEQRPAPAGTPAGASGPGNLAVAWWPQDISVQVDGTDAILRFQSTVANVGGRPVDIEPGDRLVYTVERHDAATGASEVVGRGSMPLGRADVEPFPVGAGHGVGQDLSTLGTTLTPISMLAPGTAAIVGSGQATQAIRIQDAREGLYVLRQQIVRADGSTDASSFDDARLTELMLDGAGGFLHTSSRYAGAE